MQKFHFKTMHSTISVRHFITDDMSETVRGFDGQVRTLTYSPAGLVAKVSKTDNDRSNK